MNLGSTFTTGDFNQFTRTGGTVNLTGTLTNTGNTFTFNATTGTWNLLGGTVAGGTIAFADGQTLAISTSFNNRLTGVTITGDLALNIDRRGAANRRRPDDQWRCHPPDR